jgi:hypothetical protein
MAWDDNWNSNSMEAGVAPADPDKPDENLELIRVGINAINIYDSMKPQCVNRGATALLGAGSGLQPQLLAGTTDCEGNTQFKNALTVFTLDEDISLPAAPANRRSTVILKNPASADLTQAANVDYACQRYQRADSFNAQKNALLKEASGTVSDYYGNTITVLGNPSVSSGTVTCDGTGDGIKIDIDTLGQGNWCVETRMEFDNINANETIIDTDDDYALELRRNSDNKLQLFLSSNGSSNDIKNGDTDGQGLGTKTDWSADTYYYFRVYFNGSAYKVDWSTDGETWTNELSVTSSTLIYSAINHIYVGIGDDESTNALNGAIDVTKTRVTVGNIRVGNEAFTPDAYWLDTANGIMKYGSPASWTELTSAIAVGEITTNASAVTDVQTYAYNGRAVVTQAGATLNQTYSLIHNLGVSNGKISGVYNNISGVTNIALGTSGHKIGVNSSYYAGGTTLRIESETHFEMKTGHVSIWHAYVATALQSFTTADARIIVEYED